MKGNRNFGRRMIGPMHRRGPGHFHRPGWGPRPLFGPHLLWGPFGGIGCLLGLLPLLILGLILLRPFFGHF